MISASPFTAPVSFLPKRRSLARPQNDLVSSPNFCVSADASMPSFSRPRASAAFSAARRLPPSNDFFFQSSTTGAAASCGAAGASCGAASGWILAASAAIGLLVLEFLEDLLDLFAFEVAEHALHDVQALVFE